MLAASHAAPGQQLGRERTRSPRANASSSSLTQELGPPSGTGHPRGPRRDERTLLFAAFIVVSSPSMPTVRRPRRQPPPFPSVLRRRPNTSIDGKAGLAGVWSLCNPVVATMAHPANARRQNCKNKRNRCLTATDGARISLEGGSTGSSRVRGSSESRDRGLPHARTRSSAPWSEGRRGTYVVHRSWPPDRPSKIS